MSDNAELRVNEHFIRDLLCKTYFDLLYFERANPKTVSVTEITQCVRFSWFFRKEPRCVPQVVHMMLGVVGHTYVLKRLSMAPYNFVTERLVCVQVKDVHLCGRVDAYDPKTNTVFEFKFVNTIPDEPYHDHIEQTTFYARTLQANRAYVIYISKGETPDVRVFKVYPNSETDRIMRKLLLKALYLSECLLLDRPPKAEKGRWCRWCPYKLDCVKIDRERERNESM